MSNGIVKKQDLKAYMEYEHRKKDGKLVSKGEIKIDKHRQTHFIQKDDKGKVLSETVVDRHGKVISETLMGKKLR